ncbi:MAG TPA: cyclic peptide export ABC transporter [Candidatus Angelobacter sp.]|jgi:putative ATP-binding cassette transporter|nr:cyclic peptide export ABC transporter [Candidatus Angelobacter sp.]
MKVIRFFARNARSRLLLAVAAAVVSGFSSMVLLALFTNVLKGGSRYSTITFACVLLALCLFLPLTSFISEAILARLAQGELFNLRMQLGRRILQAALRHLEMLGSARLMTAFSDDIPRIVEALNRVPRLCLNMAIALSGLFYLGWLSWRVLLLVLFFCVLGLLAYELPSIWYFRAFRAARRELDALFGHFKDLTEGVKELKLHSRRRQVFLSEVLLGTAASRSRHLVKAFRFHAIANSLGQMLVFILIGLLLFSSISGRSGTAVLPGIITVLFITNALQAVMSILPIVNVADVALQRLETLTQQLESAGVMELDQEIATDSGFRCEDLTLRAITYTYHGKKEKETFTLGPVDMSLKRGQLIVLAGGNGSGKTTLAKLITGLYSPENGELLLDGRRITDENRESYRQHFSAIFYDFHLFESLLGLEKPDLDDCARERLARLQLSDVVTIENGVLSTTQLSRGQRKRLALLTASLEDRPIYVFDEWAADQDPEFKEFFYRDLLMDLKASGKLVLVICHDDHYFDVADRIIKLESGKIIYDGVPVAS